MYDNGIKNYSLNELKWGHKGLSVLILATQFIIDLL